MADRSQHKGYRAGSRTPFECVALILQGGGAFGSYQGGAFEALAEADVHPNWVAGIFVGSINAAIIAGNAPEIRVPRLRQFWEEITTRTSLDMVSPFVGSAITRSMFNRMSAGFAMMQGAAGFFSPRMLMPTLWPAGSIEGAAHLTA